jgi:hypothetical protein
MSGAHIGSVIGAIFGLIYLLVNTSPLPAAAAIPVRVAGAVAFLGIPAVLYRSRGAGGGEAAGQPGGFGRGYWLVVAAEVAALAVGLWALDGPLHTAYAAVAWVSFVVGAHFFGLAVVFGLRFFHLLGGVIIACGIAGLGLAAVGAGQIPIAVISGLVPGAVLLAFGYWGASWQARHQASQPAD